MTTFYVRRHGNGLYAADAASSDLLGKLPEGRSLKASVTVPRDLGNHRHFFLLLDAVWRNLPEGVEMTRETLRAVLTVEAGHYEEFEGANGRLYRVPKSIAFSRMSEPEFKEFKDAVIRYVVTKLIPGLDSEALENEVYSCL